MLSRRQFLVGLGVVAGSMVPIGMLDRLSKSEGVEAVENNLLEIVTPKQYGVDCYDMLIANGPIMNASSAYEINGVPAGAIYIMGNVAQADYLAISYRGRNMTQVGRWSMSYLWDSRNMSRRIELPPFRQYVKSPVANPFRQYAKSPVTNPLGPY